MTRRIRKTLWEVLGVQAPPFPTLAVTPDLTKPLRRLRSFTEVTGEVRRDRRHDKVDPNATSFTIPIPKHLSDLEKWNRIFEMCEKADAMKEGDLVLAGISVPSTRAVAPL